ncbi:MAG: endonuclease/exonuclease/phosphatase [Chitinophagaceae bacterium]|nr:endonuclease/exonuclease/phosphatase [Chitinophagaceae bacterium]
MPKFFLILLFAFFLYASYAQKQKFVPVVIAFYNLENLYDTVHNPQVNDLEFLPTGDRNYTGKVYMDKINNLATVISQIGTDINPDGAAILGVAEIENDTVLNDLIHHPLLKERNYRFVHFDSHDARGIDVALIYNPKYLWTDSIHKLFVRLPAESKENLYTRDVLRVSGKLLNDPVHLLVNHWPSRYGTAEQTEPARIAAAETNMTEIKKIQSKNENAKIILLGDFNDNPTNTSIVKIIDAKEKPEQTPVSGFYNPWKEKYAKGEGTLAFRDVWALFDQIIISQSLVMKKQDGLFYYQSKIFKQPYMLQEEGKYKDYPKRTYNYLNYAGGYSDHLPVYIVLLKRK